MWCWSSKTKKPQHLHPQQTGRLSFGRLNPGFTHCLGNVFSEQVRATRQREEGIAAQVRCVCLGVVPGATLTAPPAALARSWQQGLSRVSSASTSLSCACVAGGTRGFRVRGDGSSAGRWRAGACRAVSPAAAGLSAPHAGHACGTQRPGSRRAGSAGAQCEQTHRAGWVLGFPRG